MFKQPSKSRLKFASEKTIPTSDKNSSNGLVKPGISRVNLDFSYYRGDTQPLEPLGPTDMLPPSESENDSQFITTQPENLTRRERSPEMSVYLPKTPSWTGRKRRLTVDISSERKNPTSLLRNLVGKDNIGISLTQAFGATQVDTSPLPNGPKSDPVFARPSPHFQPGYSSPQMTPLFEDGVNIEPIDIPSAIEEEVSTSQNLIYNDTSSSPSLQVSLSSQTRDLDVPHSPSPNKTVPASQIIQVPHSSRQNTKQKRDIILSSQNFHPAETIEATPFEQDSEKNRDMKALNPTNNRIVEPQYETPSLKSRPGQKPDWNRKTKLVYDQQSHFGPKTHAALQTPSFPKPVDTSSSPKTNGNNHSFHKSSQTSPSQSQPRKLLNIAEEQSQNLLDQMSFDINISNEITEAEKEYDDLMQTNPSGSSPIDPRVRRHIVKEDHSLASMPPTFSSQETPQDHLGDDALINRGTNKDASINYQHIDIEMESGIPLDEIVNTTNKSTKSKIQNRLTRPRSYIKEMKSLKKKRHNQSKVSGNVFDGFAETQRSNNTQLSGVTTENDISNNIVLKDIDVNVDINQDQHKISEAGSKEVITDVSCLTIRFPNRVFTFWPQFDGYYPATCLGVSTISNKPKLLFRSDTGEEILEDVNKILYKLQLRPGDQVKVDLPNYSRKWFVVVGFKGESNEAVGNEQNSSLTDVYGHQFVVLEPKSRESLGASTNTAGLINVPISSIKLARSRVAEFDDRRYTCASTHHLQNIRSRSNTPLATSKSDKTAFLPMLTNNSTLFHNMAFAVSINDGKTRNKITDSIICNNGRMIKEGFEQIFKDSCLNQEVSNDSSEVEQLHLTNDTVDLGFTALIADEHSRKPKYMQALALGLPILHYRWIDDCVEAGHILPWDAYVLPAGKSTFLFDTIKSRSFTPYDALGEKSGLKTVLLNRKELFSGKSILFVRTKANAVDEKTKSCVFLLMALGASRIGYVNTLIEAKKKLIAEGWNYVYINDEDKKRKSNGSIVIENGKVLAHETIIQSVILGQLDFSCQPS